MRLSTTATPHGETVSGDINSLIEKVNNTFDKFNRLKKTEKIKGGERVSVEFTYDGDGLRTQKITKSSKDGYKPKVINYLYDRQHVILETNESDYTLAAYVRGINYIGRYAGSSMSYYLYNGHGDVVQTVSESGEVQNQYDYDIFGNPTLTIESYSNPIRYAGEFYDEESGLYYLRARYYNPYTGRFISEDSYWGEDVNPMSLNLYTYCYNDPIQYIDPSGHVVTDVDRERLNNKQIKDLEKASKDWEAAHKAGDKEGMADAARRGREIRSGTLKDDEEQRSDGYIVKKDTGKVVKPKAGGSRSSSSNANESNVAPNLGNLSGENYTSVPYDETIDMSDSNISSSHNVEPPKIVNNNEVQMVVGDQQIESAVVMGNTTYADIYELADALGFKVRKDANSITLYKTTENGTRTEYTIKNPSSWTAVNDQGHPMVRVRDIVGSAHYTDTLSWWHDSDGKLNVLVQPEMKNAPVQVTRAGNEVTIKAYINFTGDSDKVFSNSNLTFAEVASRGIEENWQGTFNVEGRQVSVNTQVFSNNNSPNGIMDRVPEGTSRYRNQMYLNYNIETDEIGRSFQSDGTVISTARDYLFGDRTESGDVLYDNWSITNPGKVVLYYKSPYSDVKTDPKDSNTYKTYSQTEFGNVAAHEFGHNLGLGDAYGEKGYRYAAPEWYITKDGTKLHIPQNDKMRNSQGPVSNTDVTLMLRAFQTNMFQPFPESKNYKYISGSKANEK